MAFTGHTDYKDNNDNDEHATQGKWSDTHQIQLQRDCHLVQVDHHCGDRCIIFLIIVVIIVLSKLIIIVVIILLSSTLYHLHHHIIFWIIVVIIVLSSSSSFLDALASLDFKLSLSE